MRNFLSEFLGTFFLVLCGTGAIILNEETSGALTHEGVSLAFGLAVFVVIISLGKISGAHINPAVTITMTIARKFPLSQLGVYIIAQITGALASSLVLHYFFPGNEMLGSTTPHGSYLQSFMLEVFMTFILLLVILYITHGAKESGLRTAVIVGGVVFLEAYFGGPVSGASMNPARSIAPAFISGHMADAWIYVLAPISGAVAAALLWKCVSGRLHRTAQ